MPIREENQQKCVSNGSELDITTPPPDYYTLFPNPVLVQNSREPPNSQPNATFILITPNENRPDNHNVQNEVTINRSQSYAPAHSRGNVVTSVPVLCAFTSIVTQTAVPPQIDTTSDGDFAGIVCILCIFCAMFYIIVVILSFPHLK
ncbi:uncharacterized protein LOC116349648 isoform X2 [Contarinia nasturtii]|uniref:uncharacterized protein LOC116349648 isoform X2 n=1 Tax=Contarinia nasturtii TaxID=265458 RepID=UPI0012D387AC|nr:uncharacterized protein LOC116349648 isoform X2 [Contarinia nasturtii]